MRSEKKILKIGIVKPYQANATIKDLLGDESVASDECQKNVQDRHHQYYILLLNLMKTLLWILKNFGR